MLKRALMLTTAVLALAPAAASADFHPACVLGGTAASVGFVPAADLQPSATFSGTIRCRGAASARITSLEAVTPAGTRVAASEPLPSCVDPCSDVLVASGTVAGLVPGGGLAGPYQVVMRFEVVGHDGRTYRPSRTGVWAWLGMGPAQRLR